MSLLWMDGFDAYGISGGNLQTVMESSLYVHAQCYASNATRTGRGCCIQLPYNSSTGSPVYLRKAFDTKSEIIVGFAWKLNVINNLKEICRFQYDNHFGTVTSQLAVYMTADGAVTVASSNGASMTKLIDSGPNVLFPNVWHYIEVKLTLGDDSGFVQVRVDGQTCISATGRTKDPAAPALCNLLKLANYQLEDAVSNDTFVDDLYILDTSGSDFNSFLGDVVVHTVMPAGDGGTNELSQFGGGLQHYTAVDDIPSDEDLSYVYGNVVGKRELFTVDPLPTNVINVLAVSVHARAKKDAAGASMLKLACKQGGVVALGPAESVTTQYLTRSMIYTLAPDGGGWTRAKAEAMQIGFEVA
jgi:hypothetical protein